MYFCDFSPSLTWGTIVCVNAHFKVSDLINSYYGMWGTQPRKKIGPNPLSFLPDISVIFKAMQMGACKMNWGLIVSRMLQCIVFFHRVLISGMVDRCPGHWADSLHLPSHRLFDTTVGCPCFSLRIMLLWMLMSRSLSRPEIDLEKILEAGRTGSPAGENVNLKTNKPSNCFPQCPCIWYFHSQDVRLIKDPIVCYLTVNSYHRFYLQEV